jgi:hypothetical protein
MTPEVIRGSIRRMIASRLLGASFLVVLVCLGLSCGDDDGGVCAPGMSAACVGPGGCAGGQVCNAAGSGFAECVCAAGMDAGAGTDAGVGTDAPAAPDVVTPVDTGVDAPMPSGICDTGLSLGDVDCDECLTMRCCTQFQECNDTPMCVDHLRASPDECSADPTCQMAVDCVETMCGVECSS